jgi:long-chain acyl-CoA synthetase
VQQFDTPAANEADPDMNATDLLMKRVHDTPDLAIFSLPQADGSWKDVTAAEFHRQVVALSKGLVAAGIQPGDKIGLICRTRYEWTLLDFATWFAGAILVPVYETSSPHQIHFDMQDSGAIAMITETAEQFSRFDEVHGDLPLIGKVWKIDLGDLDKLAASGGDVTDEEIERRRSLAKASDVATLIYTAGTTGNPKGCILTHSNFVQTSLSAMAAIPEVVGSESRTLLFITTAHVFARFISILCVAGGVKVGHQADTSQLLPAMASFKPTFLLAVPRVFEKVYNSAEQKAEGEGNGKIFRRAAQVAIDHSKAVDAGHVPLGLSIRFAVLDRLVLSKLRAAMGGEVKYAVSGSAPLGLRLGHFYRSVGLTILEGYGLTETTAPLTVNLPSNFKIGTVGPPLPGVSIRIADDGEIEGRGVDVFDGYWQNQSATDDAFDDGWFKTGDIGSLDDEGYLTITGRKKEIIVTAGGKNVSPAVLEDPIRANPIISQVVCVGEQKPFIAALVTLDEEMLPTWLKNNGHAPMTTAQAANDPAVQAEVQKSIDAANTHVSRAESIRKFVILPEDFSEAKGQMTPKFSIKRGAILKDFHEQVEDLYGGEKIDTERVATVKSVPAN